MSNIAGKAYGMTVITPVPTWASWFGATIFRAVRCFPSTLSALIGLSIIHFARWAIIRRDQWPDLGNGPQRLQHDCLLFCSNFNGTWDQYIDAFSAGVPSGLNLLWYRNLHFPGAVPNTPFKNYIRANQLTNDFYYNATPGVAQRDIKSALRVRSALTELERAYATRDAAEFAGAYRAALISVQNDLGSHGPSPVASTDTAMAEANKLRRLREGLYSPAG